MPTILLVDDNQDYRETTQEVLEMEGYTVVPAANGAVALSLIQQSKPDLILSNGNMPIMTGIELLQAVKADVLLQDIPFVMITGQTEHVNVAYKLGAAAVLIKPAMISELLSVLGNLLK